MQKNTSDTPSKPGIGIDFGTSNSAAAIFDGERVRLVQLSEVNPIMPSANYIDRDFASTIGQLAIDDYISDNQGRKVELSVEVIGEARTSAGTADGPASEAETSKVYGQAFNDASLPGRLFRVPSACWVIQPVTRLSFLVGRFVWWRWLLLY